MANHTAAEAGITPSGTFTITIPPPFSLSLTLFPSFVRTSVLAIFGLAITTYLISSIIAYRRLRAFDGPFLASFSYVWIIRNYQTGRMGETLTSLHTTYDSPAVRIGPNDLLVKDPDVLKRTSAARSRYTRSNWYALNKVDPYHDHMFSTTDTAAHDKIKAKTAAGYAGKDNPTFEKDMDDLLREMVGQIRTKVSGRQLLDLATMVQYFTLDSISKVAFGQAFGYLRAQEDLYGFIASMREFGPTFVTVAAVPYLADIMSTTLMNRLLGPKPTDKTGMGVILGLGQEVVSKRWNLPDAKDKQDMLGSFIRHGMTEKQCQGEAMLQLVAGSDTTATSIRATMLHIITNPRVYRALQAEIDQGIKDGKVSSPITSAEAQKLPYLQAVIYEGLRIHPPFHGLNSKLVPPEGDTIAGKFVPGGTRISPSIFGVTRNNAVFGDDADLFRPERWLEASSQQAADMKKITDLVFGYGRWACAGKVLAFMELNKTYVELLRHFDFQLAYPLKPWDSVHLNLFLQKDMWVSVTERESKEK
ncbi:cytochrome P450 monooxygenase [Apodospora peruviana]|uniref:Cytochrome P450 monooxygenase ABA1 n=1 Tax=Apodospora peruviana TaxID=516989 RepID=A0AAE0MG95_9PEZI|nr:cytochrome P450 monooxygenase [Apodospora peruviana]